MAIVCVCVCVCVQRICLLLLSMALNCCPGTGTDSNQIFTLAFQQVCHLFGEGLLRAGDKNKKFIVKSLRMDQMTLVGFFSCNINSVKPCCSMLEGFQGTVNIQIQLYLSIILKLSMIISYRTSM